MWAGLHCCDPMVIIDGLDDEISGHNDGKGVRLTAPFTVISKVISKHIMNNFTKGERKSVSKAFHAAKQLLWDGADIAIHQD